MRHLLFLAVFYAVAASAMAQRKHFFDAYQGGLLINVTDFSPAPNQWQSLLKNRYPVPYMPDSMEIVASRGWRISPGFPGGIILGAQKYLGHIVRSKKANRITWTTQLQVEGGSAATPGYSDVNLFRRDTTDFTGHTTSITVKRTRVNIYNAIDLRFKSLLFKKVEYNIGVGVSLGSDMTNTVIENLDVSNFRWDAPLRFFRVVGGANIRTSAKGKNIRHASLVVPFGATLHVNSKLSLSLVHHYVLVSQQPGYSPPGTTIGAKNTIEGYQLHFTVVFRPHA